VGDLFMSLIHTCQLCGTNSFDYLMELQRHARQLAANPIEWMPWNYRETLPRSGQAGVMFRNAHKTGFPESKIRLRFGPATETVENVPRSLYARVSTNDQQTLPM
jgi:hypothetical protein